MPKQLFQVRYEWTERGKRHEGRTVVTHLSQQEAEAKFQRQYPHVTVIRTPLVKPPGGGS